MPTLDQMEEVVIKCIVFEDGDRMVVDTSKSHANMMYDTSRPFAVVEKIKGGSIGRVTCKGRYETIKKAKAALKYLR